MPLLVKPQALMLTKEVFVDEELQFCGDHDIYTRNSLNYVLQNFDDTFLVLEADKT
jgi:hypothetical protein